MPNNLVLAHKRLDSHRKNTMKHEDLCVFSRIHFVSYRIRIRLSPLMTIWLLESQGCTCHILRFLKLKRELSIMVVLRRNTRVCLTLRPTREGPDVVVETQFIQ